MSYILEALKKSDQERKSGGVPTLQTVHIPVAVEDKRPWSLYTVITILLLLLVSVTVYVMLGKEAAKVAETDQVSAPVEVEKPSVKPEVPLKSQADVLAAQQAKIPVQEKPAERVAVDTSVAVIPVAKPVIEKKPVQVKKKPQRVKEKLPALVDIAYLHELPEYLQQSIPDLSFAGHIYSSSAFNRSVIINGNEMAEGDRIMEGFIVKEITASGVIFVFQETVFRVDILQDWSFE
ncbi:hypothetical protein MNBD_GAMMA11-2596 [hydrothermal vent metagenome]|uniref:Type II secretion system protein GspB C-terminal domain-containing protein n=1 Tax=hydrothermal vent metagenome TaxID=652676 RepID=A0A3B0XFK3_9ZZZZ